MITVMLIFHLFLFLQLPLSLLKTAQGHPMVSNQTFFLFYFVMFRLIFNKLCFFELVVTVGGAEKWRDL
jgi:hypothetical protein